MADPIRTAQSQLELKISSISGKILCDARSAAVETINKSHGAKVAKVEQVTPDHTRIIIKIDKNKSPESLVAEVRDAILKRK